MINDRDKEQVLRFLRKVDVLLYREIKETSASEEAKKLDELRRLRAENRMIEDKVKYIL